MTAFDSAVCTIFAREFLEGAIIIGEYRTVVLKSDANEEDKRAALRSISLAALVATVFAILVVVCVAVPLLVLSSTFDDTTAEAIEGASKIVAGICILQLSLKIPKFLGFYGSRKSSKEEQLRAAAAQHQQEKGAEPTDGDDASDELDKNKGSAHGEIIPGLTMRSIQFNVAWNIWREVAECGIFLIPTFLSGDKIEAIPLSAVIGALIGFIIGFGIYLANQRMKNKKTVCIFAVLLLVFLSAGLTVGGAHSLEEVIGETKVVYDIEAPFWSSKKLPMAILKIFGYSNERTRLQISVYWLWLGMTAVLHYFKYRSARIAEPAADQQTTTDGEKAAGSDGNTGSDVEESTEKEPQQKTEEAVDA